MDMEKQNVPRGETGSGENAPPVLTAEDVAALEGMCGDVSGYFYKMLDYMDQRIRDGVRRGEFTEEQARADLELALWYAYACNNVDDYDYYYKAAEWMPASEPAARAARSGIWYYRYACALMYCGRLEEARQYAETGVALDPDYPWGWLETGKLRAHFGDRDGALEAVRRGLELVPGDYEFTTLRREIQEGRSLEEMEFHWIDPEADRRLQAGEDENADDKRRAIACILRDEENLAAVKDVLRPTEWEADAPYCTFTMPYGDGALLGRYFGNEASLSKVPVSWVVSLVNRLPALERRGLTFLSVEAGVGTEGMALSWFAIQPDRKLRLCFRAGDDQELFDYVIYAYQEFLGNHQYKERFLNNIISAFFIILLRNHGSDVIVPEIATEGNDENVVFILKYMQENYSTVTLSGLAEFFNYSERQIQRIIKKSTGCSFSENIQKLKMKHAAQLLSDPDRSISAISEELGYSDTGNFRHIFRKYYGMTPAEYRSQPGNEGQNRKYQE